MNRAVAGGLAAALLLLCAAPARAAGGPGLAVHPLSVAPFVLLLLCIAVLPLVAEQFWNSNRNRALVSVGFALPVVAYLLALHGPTHGVSTHALLAGLEEYVAFLALLGALYVVAGGIVIEGTLRASPTRNTLLLGCGALLANVIGTTGASMLLIRPYLRMNRGRERPSHLPVFFIFLVSNLGGLLTPLGDPPLFLGFLKGVPFTWTLRLWAEFLFANGLVLGVFYAWEVRTFHPQEAAARAEKEAAPRPLGLAGAVNLPILAAILAAVLLQSGGVRAGLGIPPLPVSSAVVALAVAAVLLALAGLSLALTPGELRRANAFTWGPIVEVGVIFFGVFVTLVPVLQLLQTHGHRFGLERSWQYFWLTGLLSSFLDSAPTYLAFATVAAGAPSLGGLAADPLRSHLLEAISTGAVFMGANSYIGNGPNFMVKAIADEAGVSAPSFFGYLAYSGAILLPVFVLVTLLFYPPWG